MNHFLTPIVIQRINRDQTATCFFSDQLGVLLVKLPLDKHDFRIMFPCGLDQFLLLCGRRFFSVHLDAKLGQAIFVSQIGQGRMVNNKCLIVKRM